jgi:transposase-like protein
MSEETKAAAGRKPRRRYAPEEKIRLLDQTDKPGESIGTVARRHGVDLRGVSRTTDS